MFFSLAGCKNDINGGCDFGNCAQQKFELFEALVRITNQPIFQCSKVAVAYGKCSKCSTGNRREALPLWHCRHMAYLGMLLLILQSMFKWFDCMNSAVTK